MDVVTGVFMTMALAWVIIVTGVLLEGAAHLMVWIGRKLRRRVHRRPAA